MAAKGAAPVWCEPFRVARSGTSHAAFFAEMFTVLIPARYASTRLPGKPLLDLAGKPMKDFIAQLNAHMMSNQYPGLLKKANLLGSGRSGSGG